MEYGYLGFLGGMAVDMADVYVHMPFCAVYMTILLLGFSLGVRLGWRDGLGFEVCCFVVHLERDIVGFFVMHSGMELLASLGFRKAVALVVLLYEVGIEFVEWRNLDFKVGNIDQVVKPKVNGFLPWRLISWT